MIPWIRSRPWIYHSFDNLIGSVHWPGLVQLNLRSARPLLCSTQSWNIETFLRIIDSVSRTSPGSLLIINRLNDAAGGQGEFLWSHWDDGDNPPTARDNTWQYVTTFLPGDNAARDVTCRLWRGSVTLSPGPCHAAGCRHSVATIRDWETDFILHFISTAKRQIRRTILFCFVN